MENVILLHGIGARPWMVRPLARFLERQHYRVLNLRYPSRRHDLDALAEQIHPAIAAFIGDGAAHFIGHSMGGLVIRAYLARYPATRLGRIVMLGTPNGGSEIADLMHSWFLFRRFFGPAGQQLVTHRPADYPLPAAPIGIIAGDRAIDPIGQRIIGGANDGKVSVASTRLAGMADHLVVPVAHTLLPAHPEVQRQVLAFIKEGAFARP